MPKASTPWSVRTISEGGTDSPVGDLVPIPDKISPVVNTGFIALSGKYTGLPADDLTFTFQDPLQALGPGADIEFPVNMLRHEMLILAVLDTGGNAINVDIIANNPSTLSGPYTPFEAVGVNGSQVWKYNKTTSANVSRLEAICNDNSEDLSAAWAFFKIINLRGTQVRLVIHNNEATDAGIVSTAYLRLV